MSELIRQSAQDSLLIIPDTNKTIKPFNKDIRLGIKSKSIEIFLDDLERFEDHVESIEQLVNALKNHFQLFFWATIRNGGPTSTIQQSEKFRQLRENLDHVVLQPVDKQGMDKVAEQANEAIPNQANILESSFSFVEHKQFEEMRRRWRIELSQEAKQMMRCAAALDDRGISLEKARWQRITAALGKIDITKDWADAWTELVQQNFLPGGIPEPGYLKQVVDDSYQHSDAAIKINLASANDAEAMLEWCNYKALLKEYQFAEENLTLALEWVNELQEPILKSRILYGEGYIAYQQQNIEKAEHKTTKAVELAKLEKSKKGYIRVAIMSRAQGFYKAEQQPEAAANAYQQAIQFAGQADNAEGCVEAARASLNLGILKAKQQPEAAAKAYQQAIQYAVQVDNAEGQCH